MNNEYFLEHTTIVITRSAAHTKEWEKVFAKYGATVYSLPTIETVVLPSTSEIQSVYNRLNTFDWLIFTSAAGVEAFLETRGKESLEKARTESMRHELPKIAAIGSKTAAHVAKAGIGVHFQPSVASEALLAKELEPVKQKKILLLQGNLASQELAHVLERRGGIVTKLLVYETRTIQKRDGEFELLIEKNKIDYLLFASPSAIQGFFRRVSENLHDKVRLIPVVAIGPTTARAAHMQGFRDVSAATTSSAVGIIEQLKAIEGQNIK